MASIGAQGDLRRAIGDVVAGVDLDESAAYAAAMTIIEGAASPAQIAGLLVGLRMKGETVAEITGFARAMRDRVARVPVDPDSVVDPCGTGGDGRGSFNVSTVSAFVAAGAGVRVAKHGNRAVSSRCGSAELLEALGVEIDLAPEEAARALGATGLAFLFAPRYHLAARHAVTPRREIGVRSIFNIVGPLTNPAFARRQVLGVFDAGLTEPLAEVLGRLGSVHCLVVHGEDGMDEITLGGRTRVTELRFGRVVTWQLEPRDHGFRRRSAADIAGADPRTNARIAEEVLAGRPGAPREICLLNAAASIYVSGLAGSLAEGIRRARASIDSGAAMACLMALRQQRFVGGQA